ncbi:hypothetical protein [Chondrinema litorale]|uniref:hypothetical protein n=1 Tax=Chondrinema litorale TaxID=2994555 RepID=UPI002542B959|nr:hypothetical protein [Chondrinema litorale]UZR95312.1 hypothetical protein OQ292_05695 [Chondrinema litorale]
MRIDRSILGKKNVLARQVFRGRLYYEKICYHCLEPFLTIKQDTLSCQNNTCRVTISRRVRAGKALNKLENIPEYPLREIDFVKYGMEALQHQK